MSSPEELKKKNVQESQPPQTQSTISPPPFQPTQQSQHTPVQQPLQPPPPIPPPPPGYPMQPEQPAQYPSSIPNQQPGPTSQTPPPANIGQLQAQVQPTTSTQPTIEHQSPDLIPGADSQIAPTTRKTKIKMKAKAKRKTKSSKKGMAIAGKEKSKYKKYRYLTRIIKGSILPILFAIISWNYLASTVRMYPGIYEYRTNLIILGFLLGFICMSGITIANMLRAKKNKKEGSKLKIGLGIIAVLPFLMIVIFIAFFSSLADAWQFSTGFFISAIFPLIFVLIFEISTKGKFYIEEIPDMPESGRLVHIPN